MKLRELHAAATTAGDAEWTHFVEDYLLHEQAKDVKAAADLVRYIIGLCVDDEGGWMRAVVCCVVAARAPSSSSLQPPPSLPQLARATLTTQRPTRTAGHNHNNDHDSSNNKHSTFFKNFR